MSEQKKDQEGPKPIAPGIPINAATGEVITSAVTPDWEKKLYTPERWAAVERGEMTLRDYHGLSGPEMLQMALVGFRMYENGKYADAETLFRGLIMLEPAEAYYFTALGAVYLATERFEEAKFHFDQAIRLNPKEIAPYVNRGEVHLRLGQIMEAAEDFAAAVKLDPEGKDPLVGRARLLAAAALEMIEQAQAEGDGEKPKTEKKTEPAKSAKPAAKKAEPPKKAATPAKKK